MFLISISRRTVRKVKYEPDEMSSAEWMRSGAKHRENRWIVQKQMSRQYQIKNFRIIDSQKYLWQTVQQ